MGQLRSRHVFTVQVKVAAQSRGERKESARGCMETEKKRVNEVDSGCG